MRIRMLLLLLVLGGCVLSLLFALGSCLQGINQRCQINSDCESGLVCSAATGLCTNQTNAGIDALVPDAAPIDAPTLDAPKDATKMDAKLLDAPHD